jgi:chromosome segregation ATPase
MNLSALFPPTLIKRVTDDIGAVADAVRRIPEFEAQLLDRLDRIQIGLAELNVNLAPIRELPKVHEAVAPLSGQLDRLETTAKPIHEISEVRRGIEPLDEDMHAVRHSVDDLEPLIREVNRRLGALDARIDDLRSDLAPLGQLAEKIPGVG